MRYAYSNFSGAVFLEVGLCPAYAMPQGQTRNCQGQATHIPTVFPRLLSVFEPCLANNDSQLAYLLDELYGGSDAYPLLHTPCGPAHLRSPLIVSQEKIDNGLDRGAGGAGIV